MAIGYGVPCPKPTAPALVRDATRRKLASVNKRKRHMVRKRDKDRCRCCKHFVEVGHPDLRYHAHVHHIVYRSQGGGNEPSNLVTLCASCHTLIHAGRIFVTGRTAAEIRFHRKDVQHGMAVLEE